MAENVLKGLVDIGKKDSMTNIKAKCNTEEVTQEMLDRMKLLKQNLGQGIKNKFFGGKDKKNVRKEESFQEKKPMLDSSMITRT